MEKEKKDRATNAGKVDNLTEQPQDSGSLEVHDANTESPAAETQPAGGNPGRMIMTGVITAAILAIIAVAVAGVFQVTSRWLIECPHDLPVNDPAPVLWQKITSNQLTPASLGVPQTIMMQARFKGTVSTADTGKERKN